MDLDLYDDTYDRFCDLLPRPGADRLIAAILAFFWLWMGLVYHILHFSAINKAAYVFGAVFILQGFLLLYWGLYHRHLRSGLAPICAGTPGPS